MEEFINTFHIDWKLMIAQLFNFGIVFLAFYLLAAKPLRKLMQERGELISRGVSDAKQNSEVLEKTKKEYDDMLTKARREADNIFQNGKKEGEANKAKMIEEGKNEARVIIENGKKSLETERTKMVEEAKKDIASLGVLIAQKIMQESNK
ncbi:MAG TPA: F0F1 ATP synthase subunit B [Candidatus Paceibacterota bacterium]|nr:F0F1 ATP synthase subunit B [Candidatus Paceibacterota bacterium]